MHDKRGLASQIFAKGRSVTASAPLEKFSSCVHETTLLLLAFFADDSIRRAYLTPLPLNGSGGRFAANLSSELTKQLLVEPLITMLCCLHSD